MKKNLEVSAPYIAHAPEDSFVFSVLGNKKEAEEWLYLTFQPLYIWSTNQFDAFAPIDFYRDCPFFEIKEEMFSPTNSNGDFTDKIEQSINSDYYISTMIRTKYVSNYNTTKDYNHHLHIYGYDNSKSELNIMDHFRRGYFTFEKCSYNEINLAIQNLYEGEGDIDIMYIKVRENIQFEINKINLINQLEDYIEGVNCFIKYTYMPDQLSDCNPNEFVFGSKFYDVLFELSLEENKLFQRPIYALFAHAKIMYRLVEIVFRKYGISVIDKCKEFLALTEIIKNLYLENKCLYKASRSIHISQKIKAAKDFEKDILSILLKELNLSSTI